MPSLGTTATVNAVAVLHDKLGDPGSNLGKVQQVLMPLAVKSYPPFAVLAPKRAGHRDRFVYPLGNVWQGLSPVPSTRLASWRLGTERRRALRKRSGLSLPSSLQLLDDALQFRNAVILRRQFRRLLPDKLAKLAYYLNKLIVSGCSHTLIKTRLSRDLRAVNRYHQQSHGESFLSLFTNRFEQGIYILDEPEAALSPQRQLSFLRIIHELETPAHAQFLIATYSPIILSYPGAVLFSLDSDSIREIAYQETEHYRVTRDFLNAPERYFKHLFRAEGGDESDA